MHRIEEVHAREAVRPRQRGAHLRHAERRRVRCDDGACRSVLFDVVQQRQLEVDLFRRGLDDEVRAAHGVSEIRCRAQSRLRSIPVRSGHLAELDALLENRGDSRTPFLERRRRHVVQRRIVAGHDGGMRDTMPHRPRPDHRDRLNHVPPIPDP